MVSWTPYAALVVGIADGEDAKEKPEPSKSKKRTLPNLVMLLGLSTSLKSFPKILGPTPATLAYWADLPGAPTTTTSGLALKPSGFVTPSFP